MWDWEYARSILPKLLVVIPTTLVATLAAFILACLLGLPIVLARRSNYKWLSLAVYAITEFIRSTPLLIQLFVLVFVLPQTLGLTLSPLLAGIIGLGIHYSTYLSEVYRSGIESIPKGQWEASKALNFNKFHTWTRIILPQSIPPIFPVMGNYLIILFKETPTLSAITVVELLMTAKVIGSESFKYVEAFTLVGVIFFLLSFPSALLVRRLESRVKQRERRRAF
ncbi:ectoine/hydroxyectoine ABC transporter permease subunit EhuD [Paenibacillus sp. L3-i20]|uniref:ectoine/hydroxyectoine ABC transporter permease subunit EhuD n=1 Tax=Paenibacillus sp. L3-i20 TaxID=2905833 RepID=UPI001EDDF5C5|nr:ectoine/hydroxyectoine ABC transporter permease subunit EhuD [Paenibacillus sp. L3-i20]GKU79091.1 ectoine/hydroxyectoine ABC transporter permease subunit EhuD [Paenibacillus sp. L3-i20]